MRALPQAQVLEIIFEVPRKRSNGKISFSTYKTFFSLFLLFGPLLLSKLLTFSFLVHFKLFKVLHEHHLQFYKSSWNCNNNIATYKEFLGCSNTDFFATLLWESVRMRLTLPKWGLGSPPGLLKVQSSMARVKTPRIGELFISLEIYQSVDVQIGLAWPIWTSATQVMTKRKVGSQTGNLTPDHGKSGIDLIPMRAGGVRHVVEKFSTRATTLV
jgi:hypothetical protein